MKEQLTLMGMVLSVMPISDYDKRLVILTKERGKITAFAKGARKQNSSLLAGSQPFSFGEFVVYETRTAYTLLQIKISNYFVDLREDLAKVYYACYFCEVTDYFTREENNESEVLKLLYQSFRILGKDTISLQLIKNIFELKMLVLNGIYPQIFECIKCNKKSKLTEFSFISQGMICDDCKEHTKDTVTLQESTIYAMQYIITSSVEKLFTFVLGSEIEQEFKFVMKRYMSLHVDKEFQSLRILNTMNTNFDV